MSPASLADSTDDHENYAPYYHVPARSIVSVEHPFIIQNIFKGIESLGGASKIQRLVQTKLPRASASLYFRPRDRMSNPVESTNVETDNVILHFTVPRRTGRKRKRGSSEPYTDQKRTTKEVPSSRAENTINSIPATDTRDTSRLLGSLRDNVDRYSIRPVGSVEQTHRFRTMSDFVWSTCNSPFVMKMRENILPFEYDKLKGFKFDMSKGVKENTDLIPPPRFTHISIPFNYSYRQNPSVRQSIDQSGKVTTVNTQEIRKLFTQRVSYNVDVTPTGPTDDLDPLTSLDPQIQRLIHKINELFDERPIWTRRAITNQVRNPEWANIGKFVYQYVGYMFDSGPWSNAVVRFGVDPRRDPKYRFYQTMMFQLYGTNVNGKSKQVRANRRQEEDGLLDSKQDNNHTHLFDGTHVGKDGKVWQVCDITDPLLKSILDTPNIRDECDTRNDGWYHNGTWAKAKVILRYKLTDIISGRSPEEFEYVNLVRIPDILDASNKNSALFQREKATAREREMAPLIRAMASEAARLRPRGAPNLAGDTPTAEADDNEGNRAEADGGVDARVKQTMHELNELEEGHLDDDLIDDQVGKSAGSDKDDEEIDGEEGREPKDDDEIDSEEEE